MSVRLDKLRRGDWVRWQDTPRKIARVEHVSESLVRVSFYTDTPAGMPDHLIQTRPIGAGLRVPQERAVPREQEDGRD